MLILIMINFLAVFYCLSGLGKYPRMLIWKLLYPGVKFKEDFLIKPLECSWCLATWVGLFSLIWVGFTPLNVILALVMAYMNTLLIDVLALIKDSLGALINRLYSIIVYGKKKTN